MRTRRRGFVLGLVVAFVVVAFGVAVPVARLSARSTSVVPAPVVADLAYAGESRAQALDLWVPTGSPRPYPLVIFVHGGGFSGGDKGAVGSKVGPLLAAGYAVASVNYRLSGQAGFPAAPRDVKAAVRFLRAGATTYGVDPRRFAAWGESAGANLAALTGTTGDQRTLLDDPGLGDVTTSAAVQAVVEWYGPIDFAQRESELRSGGTDCRTPQLVEAERFTTGYLGQDVDGVPDRAAAANPISYVRAARSLPPFSIATGTADCLVPVAQAQQLAVALHSAGALVDLRLLRGAVHADPLFDREVLPSTIAWLNGVLRR